jgi:hypothetical protein
MEDLRTSPITQWLEAHSKALQGFSDNVSASKTALRERDVLLGRIASIDDDYFARAAAIMGDTQQLALERLRLRRARDRMVKERHSAPLMSLELADHVDTQLLDQAMQGLLYDWEDRRTALLKAHVLAKRTQQAKLTEMGADLQEQYQDFASSNDTAQLEAVVQMAQEKARILREPANKTAEAIATHAWQGARSLADALPLEDAHSVRLVVLQRLGVLIDDDYKQNLRSNGLNSDHVLIRPLLEDYWSDMAGLSNTAALTLLDLGTNDMVFFSSNDIDENPWQKRFDAKAQAQKPLNERARRLNNDLGALGGPGQPLSKELARRMDDQASQSSSSVEIVMSSSVGGLDLGDAGATMISSSMSIDGGMFGHEAMSMGSMLGYRALPVSLRGRLIRDLALDEASIELLDAHIAAHAQALEEAQTANTPDAGSNQHQLMISPFGGNGKGQEATQAADTAFFSTVASLGNEEALQWHRLARQRSLSNGGGMGMISTGLDGAGQGHQADPTEALEASGLNDTQITQSLQALEDWHVSATAAASELQVAQAAQSAAFQSLVQNQISEHDDNNSAVAVSMSIGSPELKTTQERVNKAQADLAAANREGIDTLVANLGEVDGLYVQRAWLISAYPSILGKGDPLETSFATAMNVDNLTDAQRGEIAMIRMEHDRQWWASSETIISDSGNHGGLLSLMPGASEEDAMALFAAFQRNNEELERKKFTRREVALKQLAALREVLTASQRSQAGGLPDPAAPRNQSIMSF